MANRAACCGIPFFNRVPWIRVSCVCLFCCPSVEPTLCPSFYFPGFLVGPYLTYNEYQALVTGSLYKAAEQREESAINETNHLSQRLVPHGRKRVAYRKMFNGLVFLALFVLFYPEFNFTLTVEDEFESRRLFSRYVSCL